MTDAKRIVKIDFKGVLLTPPIDELRKSLGRALRQVVRSGRDAKSVRSTKHRVAQVLRQMNAEQVLIDYFEGKFDRAKNRPRGAIKYDDRAEFLKQFTTPLLELNKDVPHYRMEVARWLVRHLQTEEGLAAIRGAFGSDQTFTPDEIRKAAGCRGNYK